jgi:hypothetical protein
VLKVHETTTASGALSAVFLRFEDRVLSIVADDGTFALPEGALDAVMARFGAPLEPTSQLIPVATFDLEPGYTLRHVRHLARYDVIARDYLVYEAAGREPLCALATTVAGALDHVGRAVARRNPPPSQPPPDFGGRGPRHA